MRGGRARGRHVRRHLPADARADAEEHDRARRAASLGRGVRGVVECAKGATARPYHLTVRRPAAVIVLVALLVILTAGIVLSQRSAVAELRSVPTVRADARVDSAVTEADLVELGRTVERSVSYVEGLFEHKFVTRPKLVLFGTTGSFSTGLAQLFDYSEGDVTLVAAAYGGIYDRTTSTIAVNLQTIGPTERAATLEHELTHYMMRELTAGRDLPAR